MTVEANPYAPPVVADPSAVTAAAPTAVAATQEASFFAVSPLKLAVLSIVTFNIYSIYWYAKQWGHIRKDRLPGISPFWRAIFSVFFTHDLFRRIGVRAVEIGVDARACSPADATLYVIFALAGSIAGRFSSGLGLVGLIAIVPLVRAQADISRILARETPDADENSHFSALNWVAIVFGAMFWVLSLIGLFLT
jgi:hypothetical protein